MKLEMQHKHILHLIERDKDAEGWAKVSNFLYPVLSKNMPVELIEFAGEEGRYKAKLTEEGKQVINVIEKWL